MNLFDKICGVFAFVLGVIFILLGVVGAVDGCNAHFALPPVIGAIPFFVGWGIVRPVWLAWRAPNTPAESVRLDPNGCVLDNLPCRHCSYNLRTQRYDGRCPECGKPVAWAAERFLRPEPTQLDETSVILDDVRCESCGQNLRGCKPGQNCPRCEAPVSWSIK